MNPTRQNRDPAALWGRIGFCGTRNQQAIIVLIGYSSDYLHHRGNRLESKKIGMPVQMNKYG